MKTPLDPAKIIAKYSNNHGWFYYEKFNRWLIQKRIKSTKMERHNRTDGELHFKYTHIPSGESFIFLGNQWTNTNIDKIVQWINQNNF